MALPASLLAAAEAHTCLTGCYGYDATVQMCTSSSAPAARSFVLACQDCLTFHVGALESSLPSGATGPGVADELTAHMRAFRSYEWSMSGYRLAGGGLWISAACCTTGLFLVDGARNRGPSDLDVLIQAFTRGIAKPVDPGMLDPAHYTSEVVYVDLGQPLGAIRAKHDLLASPQCSTRPKAGHHRMSVIEYLPLVATTSRGTAALAPPVSKAALSPGDVCPVCRAEVKERLLFSGTFVGCLC